MDNDIQFTENDHNVHIKQLDLNFIVVIRLSREVLSAMKLSEIKIKSPTKKQQISTKREAQILQYNAQVLMEERQPRYSKRTGLTIDSADSISFGVSQKEKSQICMIIIGNFSNYIHLIYMVITAQPIHPSLKSK